MASPEVYAAFHDRLVAQWSTTPLVFENEAYETANTPTAFVYVEVFGDDLNQESVGAPGANMWLETGLTYLHVMVPSGTGTTLARTYARQLTNLFREQAVAAGLFMPEMSIGAGDPGRDFPNYWAMTVSIHWYRRDITGA